MNIEELLIYRDAMILVINKPSGIAVHSGSKMNNGIDKYFDQLKFGLPKTPALAHRLDKDTSGCLVLGRHAEALRRMGKLFENGQVEKKYWAIVEGLVENDEGIINAPIAPVSDKKYQWWVKIDEENGKEAITEYRVMRRLDGKTLLELSPKTGRTHQLRIHLAHIGYPIIGDKVYGNKSENKLCLHARSLRIPLYPKKDPIFVEAEVPEHFLEMTKDLEL